MMTTQHTISSLEKIQRSNLRQALMEKHSLLAPMSKKSWIIRKKNPKMQSVVIDGIVCYRIQTAIDKTTTIINAPSGAKITVGPIVDYGFCTDYIDFIGEMELKMFLTSRRRYDNKDFLNNGLFCDRTPFIFRNFFGYASEDDMINDMGKNILQYLLSTGNYQVVKVSTTKATLSGDAAECVFDIFNVSKTVDITDDFVNQMKSV